MTREALRDTQLEYSSMSWMIRRNEEGSSNRPDWESIALLNPTSETYWSNWDRLEVQGGGLYRCWESDNSKDIKWQLLVPWTLQEELMAELHGRKTSGHLGNHKNLGKLRDRYFWAGMSAHVLEEL